MLLLKVERLSGAAKTAIEAGDTATAARLAAETMGAIQEARACAERARAQ